MRVAVCQLSSTPDAARNLRLVEQAVLQAADSRAHLAVFPEATMVPFGSDLAAEATAHYNTWRTGLGRLARESGVTIAAGIFRPADGGRVSNVLASAGSDGTWLEYRKLHLFDAFGYRESLEIEPGDRPQQLVAAGERVGLATCYDVRFPELFVHHVAAGARAVVVAASWAPGIDKVDQWRLLARARAIDTGSWVFAVDQAVTPSRPDQPSGVGHSLVVRPDGMVAAELGDDTETLVIDVDLGFADRVRSSVPVNAGRRFTVELAGRRR